MNEETDTRLTELKQRIARGDYRVDTRAIADAILCRFRESAVHRCRRSDAQSECSYPDNGTSASVKASPAGPATTWPIQVHWTPEPTVSAA